MINKCMHMFSVNMSEAEVQEHYDDFFEEIFVELEEKVGYF